MHQKRSIKITASDSTLIGIDSRVSVLPKLVAQPCDTSCKAPATEAMSFDFEPIEKETWLGS